MSKEPLADSDRKRLGEILEKRYGMMKLIAVEGNPTAFIVKTTTEVAPQLRSLDPALSVRGKSVKSVLTSGAIGKLKKRATAAEANGKVHER